MDKKHYSDEDPSYNTIGKYMDLNSGIDFKWTRADENVVRKYIARAMVYQTLYNNTYFVYNLYYKLLTYPLVIVSCISIALQMISATIITTDIGTQSQLNSILSICTTSVSIVVSILTFLQARSEYNTSANGCRKAATAFADFSDQLNTILTIHKNRRANPMEVITCMENDFNKIMNLYSQFEIPSKVYRSFIEKTDDSQILDIATNHRTLNVFNGTIERSEIIEKFVENIEELRKKETSMISSNPHLFDV